MTDETTEPGWRPLIRDAARRAEIAQVIVEIVRDVEVWRSEHPRNSDESSDYATLRTYVAADDTVPDPDDAAGEALADAVAGVGERHAAGLYGGAARVAFAVGHLSAGEDADAACAMIESSLVRYLDRPVEAEATYDLISGFVGLAVPVLQRIADGKASPSSEPLAHSILDHLERQSRPAAAGISWHTPPALLPDWQRELAPDGYTNLGLAHGIPGIVAILARYIAAGVEAARARALLDGAVTFLQSVARPTFGQRFSAWLPSHRPDAPPRVAWCYGDLGVAVAVMAAAIATGRDDWRAMALDLAHGMAARPIDQGQAVDAGLCHGAAGNAHLFNRLAQATGDAELARAADAWFTHTLAIRNREPIAGFPRGMPEDGTVKWEAAADLLTGAPGVALALHAAISSIEPAWDQLLLADLTPST